jgi:predicted RNA binding protein YcfA (HicA-like mRNA interferase family)
MTKREKRLRKLSQNIKNVSFDELRTVLEDSGFSLDHITGSHHVFRADVHDEVVTLVIPFARPVKPAYVRAALNAIEKVRQSRASDPELSDEEQPNDD